MNWCRGCDNPFDGAVECYDGEPLTDEKAATLSDVQLGQVYEGCPHCGSDDTRDLTAEAEAWADACDM